MFGVEPDLSIDGEWDWPETATGKAIAAIDSALRCAICSDFFANPHSLACGHSYCSECIRRHLDQSINPTTSSICPSCRAPSNATQLRPQKNIVDIVSYFRSARADLLSIMTGAQPKPLTNSAKLVSRNSGKLITKRIPQGHFHGQSKESIKKALEKLTEGCASHLRTEGDKEVLERRYKDFVHLSNAQLDSPDPLSIEQVVSEIHRRENARNQESKKGTRNQVTVDAMRNGIVPKDNSFSQLIEKEKQRRLQAKASAAITDTVIDNKTQQEDSYVERHEDWRMVMSKTVGKVFYYNIKTKVGQFLVPDVFDTSKGSLETKRDSNISSPVITINDDSSSDENDKLAPELKMSSLDDVARPTQTQLPTQVPESDDQAKLSSRTRSSPYGNKMQVSELDHSQKSHKSPDNVTNLTRKRGIVSISAIDTGANEKADVQHNSDDGQHDCDKSDVLINENSAETNINDQAKSSNTLSGLGTLLQSPKPKSQTENDEFEFDNEVKTVWNCSFCTYENTADAITCDICLAFKPRAKSTRSSSSQRSINSNSGSLSQQQKSSEPFNTPWNKNKNNKQQGDSSQSSSQKKRRY